MRFSEQISDVRPAVAQLFPFSPIADHLGTTEISKHGIAVDVAMAGRGGMENGNLGPVFVKAIRLTYRLASNRSSLTFISCHMLA